MAGISDAITSLIAQIKTQTFQNNAQQLAPLYSAVWNNQFAAETDYYGNLQYSIPLPAALVEVVNPQTSSDIGLGITDSEIIFRIHIGMEQLDAGDGTMDQNLTIFTLRDALITLLTDFEPTACSCLQKISEVQDYTHTNFYHYIINFKCSFIDNRGDQTAGEIIYGPPTHLHLAGGYAPVEILSVAYNSGAQALTVGYRLLTSQDVKFTVDNNTPTDAGTLPIKEWATYTINGMALSAGSHTLTATATASNFTTVVWNFSV